jgi:hypothetical protein
MAADLSPSLKGIELNPAAATEALADAEASLRLRLPADYARFLTSANGGEGFIGDDYLILWRAEDLAPFNREYEVATYAPGLLLFGSSGGGEGYGFDTREGVWSVVRVPFVGMSWQHAQTMGNSFTDLILRLGR